jgi:hypothetical protein
MIGKTFYLYTENYLNLEKFSLGDFPSEHLCSLFGADQLAVRVGANGNIGPLSIHSH